MNIFKGSFEPLTVECCGKRYIVDKLAYFAALANPPTNEWRHTIEAKIDDKLYAGMTPNIIEIIYHINGCGQLNGVFKAPSIDLLPAYLAMIDWCKTMLVQSHAIDYIKTQVKSVVCDYILISRAIANNDYSVKVLGLIEHSDIKLTIPTYLKNRVVVPVVCDTIPTDFATTKNLLSRLNMPYGVHTTCDKLLAFQNQIRNDIVGREVAIALHSQPDYMKIPDFGVECRTALHSMFDDELKIECAQKPKMTICDVFEYGLAAALAADYS